MTNSLLRSRSAQRGFAKSGKPSAPPFAHESQVANVLASMDNLPAEEVDCKLFLLQKAIMILDEEIAELKRLLKKV